ALLPTLGRPGWDYVLVGRPETTISRDFAQLRTDLERALSQIHAKP
ncbi:MAG: ribonuclease P protein component, partial [Rhodobacteraceae bacterium]|nr:ribonuclease P protein component [Paracoccaceae bacterium]